ncbi:serine hydrolase domain-containing protein [Streptomyces atriruber]|uniref:serine hydrolase domain-containing protein n=1 Tax=Streptomyces atriruber TaxID=545121 RepID=UPI000AAF7C41|nr:serine hydrolase domain-containing protein [Streptomyces atriruber]
MAAGRGRTGRAGRAGATAALAVTVTAGALAAPALAATPGAGDGHRATLRAMRAALNEDAPGVTAQAKDRHGTWNAAAGIGDLTRQTPRGAHDHYRVGSITKTFVSTVVLQLVAEGRLDLDDKVGQWLPGVVEGNGHDGDRITVRQILNHTSGIFDVMSDEGVQRKAFTEEFLDHRYDTWTPEQHIAIAMRHKPDFAPGTGWHYSNTNYVIAGRLIERITGKPYAQEIKERVIEPLGLHETSVPATAPSLPEPASRAYTKLSDAPGAKNHDVTELNPSLAGAAGGMISDSADLNRFYTALLRGELLPAKQLAEMKTTVPKGDDKPGQRYGLGLEPFRTTCGRVVWGHGGDIHGSASGAASTADGRHALALNFNGPEGEMKTVLDAEFCGQR